MDLIQSIDSLRKIYEEEWEKRHGEYLKGVNAAKAEIDRIDRTDYISDTALTYRMSLDDLEEVFSGWASLQRKTKGLEFSVEKYIRTLKPRSIRKGGLEDFVDRLVEEATAAMEAVEQSRSVEEDVKPQKAFCQCLVDFRYIVANAERLIVESGMPDRQKREDSREAYQSLEKYERALREESAETLPCYKKLLKLRADIEEEFLVTGGALLTNEPERRDNDYRFIVGLAQQKAPSAVVKFAKEAMGLPTNIFASSPIYFSPVKGNGSIIVRAPKKFFESDDCYELYTNIYFSFASTLPIGSLQFGGMERTSEAIVGTLGAKIEQSLGKSGLFEKIATDSRGLDSLVGALMTRFAERSRAYKLLDDVNNFYDYNKASPDNRQPAILCIINNFPHGAGSLDADTLDDLSTLMQKGGDKGIYIVVGEAAEDSQYSDRVRPFDARETRSDLIDLTGDTAEYNGQPVSTDIRSADFKAASFWKSLKSEDGSSSVIGLYSLLKKAEKERKEVPPFYEKLVVPIGKAGGKQLDISIKTASTQGFGFIFGKSGSGKSSFLHSFILSAAYFYPPDELEIYLMDFKDSNQSPEFSNYIQSKAETNMFLPHVRYLSLRSKKEYAIDLLNKIEVEINRRSAMFSRLRSGTSSITDYNESPDRIKKKLPKMPVALFIIDEYNAMLENDETTDYEKETLIDTISRKIGTILKRARAYGIEIIFSGQSLVPGLAKSVNQISTRILLNMGDNTARTIESLYSVSDSAESIGAELALQKGTFIYSNSDGYLSTVGKFAYGGKTGHAEHLKIVAEIREKHKNNPACKFIQTAAGSLETFPITLSGECDEGSYVMNENLDGLSEEEIIAKYAEMAERAEEETRYYLPMGASSATTLRISLGFSVKENAAGYTAFAEDTKLLRMERNMIFAAMHKRRERYPDSEIVYCSTPAEKKRFLSGFESVKERIERQVSFITDRTEIARKILNLERLYSKRAKLLDNDSVDFDPVYLVINKMEWLTPAERNQDWVPKLTGEAPVSRNSAEATLSGFELNALDAAGGDDELAALLGGLNLDATPDSVGDGEESVEVFTKAEVQDALALLYGKGNRCAIFVILCSNTFEPIDFFREKAGGKVARYGAYGSFEEMNSEDVDENSPANTVYVTPSNAATRLFDYNPTKYSEWWKKI